MFFGRALAAVSDTSLNSIQETLMNELWKLYPQLLPFKAATILGTKLGEVIRDQVVEDSLSHDNVIKDSVTLSTPRDSEEKKALQNMHELEEIARTIRLKTNNLAGRQNYMR